MMSRRIDGGVHNRGMATQPVEQLLARVIASFNAGRREEADALCAQAPRDHPEHPGLNHLGAVLSLERGEVRLALQFAERAAGLAPESAELRRHHAAAWYELGRVHRAAGEMQAALVAFESATRIDAGLVPGWFALSLVLQDLHQIDPAAQALERLLAIEAGHIEAAVNLGLLRQEQGDLDAAMAHYGMAYRQQPDTLGRIAHALCSLPYGALWTDQQALEDALREAAVSRPRRA